MKPDPKDCLKVFACGSTGKLTPIEVSDKLEDLMVR